MAVPACAYFLPVVSPPSTESTKRSRKPTDFAIGAAACRAKARPAGRSVGNRSGWLISGGRACREHAGHAGFGSDWADGHKVRREIVGQCIRILDLNSPVRRAWQRPLAVSGAKPRLHSESRPLHGREAGPSAWPLDC